jgi:tetratricopeptide (TPR) repeat protein
MPPEPSSHSPRPATARDGDTRRELRSRHLPPLETRLFLGAIPWRLRQSLLHLLRCAACREALDAELATLESGPAQPSDRRYDQVFDRAEALGQGLAEERRAALGMLDEMFQRPVEEWPNFLAQRREAAQPLFVLLLLEHAGRVAGTDPKSGEALARLAHTLTEWLDVAAVPDLLRHELQVRAWTLLGHMRTLQQEWQSADEAFAQASRLLAEAPSLDVEAELCRLVGASFQARGRQPEAIALLTRAALLADEAGTAEAEIGDLDELARLHLERADAGCAVGLLAGALVLASREGLALTAAQLRPRLAWMLKALGRDQEALAVVVPCEVAEAAAGTLEGMIGAALVHACRGELRYAEALFGIALTQAVAQSESFPAAIAALNLVGIYDQEDRADALREMAPTIGGLSEASELSGATRAALAALYAGLRDEMGSAGVLLLAAVAALDHEAQALANTTRD